MIATADTSILRIAMKSFLVQLASIVVVLHMTFGCHLHHGLGMTTCANRGSLGCHHGHDAGAGHADHHDCAKGELQTSGGHEQHSGLESERESDQSSRDRNPWCLDRVPGPPSPAGCCDDRCHAPQGAGLEFCPRDDRGPYFANADILAMLECQKRSGFSFGPIPDDVNLAPAVRLHLLYGVQTL